MTDTKLIKFGESRGHDRMAYTVAEGRTMSAKTIADRRIEQCTDRYRDDLKKSLSGVSNPRAAIASKCRECVGYEDVILRVSDCRSFGCPLWAYRPYANKGQTEDT